MSVSAKIAPPAPETSEIPNSRRPPATQRWWHRALLSSLLIIIFASLSANAAGETEDELAFDMLPAQTHTISPDASLSADQPEFTGNPAHSMLSWWPEDLVLAPIPGRTPEFGWSLAVVGGYFLDLD